MRKGSRNRWQFHLLLWALAVGLLSGCAVERAAERARSESVLLLGNGPEPESLDPRRSTSLSAFNVQMALFEGLVGPDPRTLEPVPAVATKWDVSEDGRKLRFHLREEARWSDGHPVSAADFRDAWLQALDPGSGAAYASLLYPIRGAEAYHRGDSLDLPVIRAASDRVLEVELERPSAHFLHILMHPVSYPVPTHCPDAAPFQSEGTTFSATEFVGNGPFVFEKWNPGQSIRVSASSTYWDAENVALQGIEFRIFDEPAAEERAYQAGQLHVTDSLPPTRVAYYRGIEDPAFCTDPFLATYYILPNHGSVPLNDVRVRRALTRAIDRVAIVEKLLGGGERVANQFVPDTMPGYGGPGVDAGYDPELARKLLTEAGYPEGEGFPVLRYLYNSSESHRRIAEALQAMWKSVLNIDVELVNQEWRTYLQSRESGDFDLARAVWVGDYPEPSSFLDLWQSDHPNNWIGWSEPDYDATLAMARSRVRESERAEVYATAERILLEDAAILPLYFYVTHYLKAPYVKGWYPTLLDWHPYKAVSFADQ